MLPYPGPRRLPRRWGPILLLAVQLYGAPGDLPPPLTWSTLNVPQVDETLRELDRTQQTLKSTKAAATRRRRDATHRWTRLVAQSGDGLSEDVGYWRTVEKVSDATATLCQDRLQQLTVVGEMLWRWQALRAGKVRPEQRLLWQAENLQHQQAWKSAADARHRAIAQCRAALVPVAESAVVESEWTQRQRRLYGTWLATQEADQASLTNCLRLANELQQALDQPQSRD